MTFVGSLSYQEELRTFRAQFALRAALASGGNICKAAAATGIHRNTLTRWLEAGGYSRAQVRRMAKRKPVQFHLVRAEDAFQIGLRA